MSSAAIEGLLIAGFWLGCAGIVQALALLIWTIDNARIFRGLVGTPACLEFTPRVALFVPCKGVEASFLDTVTAVLDLDYPEYSVTFVVESDRDPAYATVRRHLALPRRVPARLVVAGPANDCGQKVHNLLAATAQLDSGVEVLAFVDSDAVPDRDWLVRLVRPLRKPDTAVVTGYRWFLPPAGDWPAIVLSALNAAIAFALGSHSFNLVWGGTWAVRRTTFDQLRRRQVWKSVVTEDLPLSNFVSRRGQRIAYEPSCLVASPIVASWRSLFEFGRRQYLITRIYSPGFWWMAVSAIGFAQAVFWSELAIVAACWLSGRSAGWSGLWLASLFAVGTARGLLRWWAVRRRFPTRHSFLLRTAALDVLGHPLLGFAHLGLLVASAIGNCITWRGIRYRLRGPRDLEILMHPNAVARSAAA